MTDDLAWLTAAGATPALAEIVATVDLERALAHVGCDPSSASSAMLDALLGARVVLVTHDAVTIAIAEPSTEGRLAATLARSGEGIAGRYLEAPVGLEAVRRLAAAAGVGLSRRETGPFGPETLVLTGSPAGPHVLLVEPRALPSAR